MSTPETLPDPLPEDPLPLFAAWFAQARELKVQPNPDAMVLASVDEQCRPSARVVLCKRIAIEAGYVVFFTNYESRKGRELDARPRASAVFHWDTLRRQVRIEGPVVKSPADESDEYFASRALESRIAARASSQSRPLPSRAHLLDRVRATAEELRIAPGAKEGDVPRPAHWGGYRLWIERMELWTDGAFRVHDRAVWTRELTPSGSSSFAASTWQATRLYP
jgi:pyridoxamine 5'-phosphate oxidase